MKKSQHFGWVAVAFGISCAGFVAGGYHLLGAGVAALTTTYAVLAFRARAQEARDS
jgi:membrane protein implicated in regulation of membrane protease activity